MTHAYHADAAAIHSRRRSGIQTLVWFLVADVVFIGAAVYFAVVGDPRPSMLVLVGIFVVLTALIFVQIVRRRARLRRASTADPYVAVDAAGITFEGRRAPWADIVGVLVIDVRHQIGTGRGPVGWGRGAAHRSGAATLSLMIAHDDDTTAVDLDNTLTVVDAEAFVLAVRAEAAAAGVRVDEATSVGDSVAWGLDIAVRAAES